MKRLTKGGNGLTRRLLSLLIAFTVVFLLVGCDGVIDASSNQKEKTQTNESEKQVEEKAEDIKLEGLKVHYIDVGQADATLFQYEHEGENFNLLIDTGNFNSSNALDYLLDLGVDHIDAVMITHPHADHVGQLDKIIEKIPVDEVWMSGYTATSQTFERTIEAVLNSDTDYHEPRMGEVYDIGSLAVEILNPAEVKGDIHENCLSMRLTYGDISFVFTGDAEGKTEREMINSGMNLKAHILQLGHHGSDTSNTPEFLAAVKPEVAIYSASENNQYGHPHQSVLDRLGSLGIQVYGTNTHGTIIVSTDGKSYEVTTEKDGLKSLTAS